MTWIQIFFWWVSINHWPPPQVLRRTSCLQKSFLWPREWRFHILASLNPWSLTANAPENRPKRPKRKGSSSKHHCFKGLCWNFGGVACWNPSFSNPISTSQRRHHLSSCARSVRPGRPCRHRRKSAWWVAPGLPTGEQHWAYIRRLNDIISTKSLRLKSFLYVRSSIIRLFLIARNLIYSTYLFNCSSSRKLQNNNVWYY